MGCLTDGYILDYVGATNDWIFSNVGGARGTADIDPYAIAYARLSDGPIPGAKVDIDGSVSEGPTIDLSVIGSIPEEAPRDDEAERPYITWAGVNPMSLTEGLIVWNKEIVLLNRNAIVGNSEDSNVEFVSVVGRLMVVKLSQPVPITSAASAIITIGAGAVGMYTDEPLTTCPAEAGSPDEEPPEGEEEEEVDDTAVGIPPGGDLSPAPPSCGSCNDGGPGFEAVYEGPDLSDAYIFTDLCNPNAQCGDVEPEEGVAFSVNNAMTVPLRCCYPFVLCELRLPVWQVCWNLFNATIPLQTLPLDALEDIDGIDIERPFYLGELLDDTARDPSLLESSPARCYTDPIRVQLTGIAGPPVLLEVEWGGLLPGWKGQLVRVFLGESPCPGGGGFGVTYVAAHYDLEPDYQDVVESWVQDEIIKPMERSLSVQFFDTYSVGIVTAAFPEAFEELEIFIPGEPVIENNQKIIEDIVTTENTCIVPLEASHEYWQFGRDEPSTMDVPFIITDISTGPLPIITSIEMATQSVVVNLETEEHTVLVSGSDYKIPVNWDEQFLTLQSFYQYTELSIATGVSNVVESLTTQSVDIVDFSSLGTVTELVGQSYHTDISFIDWDQGTTSVISPVQVATTDVFLITETGTALQTVITDAQLSDLTFLTSTFDRGFVSDFSTAAVPLITGLQTTEGYIFTDSTPFDVLTDFSGTNISVVTNNYGTRLEVLTGPPGQYIADVSLNTMSAEFVQAVYFDDLTNLVTAGTDSLTFLTSTYDRGYVSNFSTAAIPLITSISQGFFNDWGQAFNIVTDGYGTFVTVATSIGTFNFDVLVGPPQGIINDVSLVTNVSNVIGDVSTAFLTNLVGATTSAITYLTSTDDRSFVIDFDTTSVTVTDELGTAVGITVVTDVNLTVLDNTTEAVVITEVSVRDTSILTDASGVEVVGFASLNVAGGSLATSNIVVLDNFGPPVGYTDIFFYSQLFSTIPFTSVKAFASIETALNSTVTVVEALTTVGLDNTTVSEVVTTVSVSDTAVATSDYSHFVDYVDLGSNVNTLFEVTADVQTSADGTVFGYIVDLLSATLPLEHATFASIETGPPAVVVAGLTTVGLDNTSTAQVHSIGTDVTEQSTFGLSKPSIEDLTVFLDPQVESVSPITDFDRSMETYPVDVISDFTTFSHTVINNLFSTEFYAYSTILGDVGAAYNGYADGDEMLWIGELASGSISGTFITYAEQTASLVISEETAAFEYVSTIATDVSTVPTSYGGTGPVSLITEFEFTSFFPIDGDTTCTVITPEISTTEIDIVTTFLSGSSTSILLPSGTQEDIEILVPTTGTADLTFITSAEAGCDTPIKLLDRGSSIACGTAVTKNWDEGQCDSCGGWQATIEPVENTDCEDFLLLRAKYVKQGSWNGRYTNDEGGRSRFLEPSCSCFDGGIDIVEEGCDQDYCCNGFPHPADFVNGAADPGSMYNGPVLATESEAQDLPYGPCIVPFQRLAISDCAFCREIPTEAGNPPQREKWPYTPTTPYYPNIATS